MEQRKVYCKAMRGDLKKPEFPEVFWENTLKSQVGEAGRMGGGTDGGRGRGGGHRVCDTACAQLSDWLMVGGRMVSQGLTLSVLRLQEAWGCVPMVLR